MTDRDKIEQEAEARIVAWLRAEEREWLHYAYRYGFWSKVKVALRVYRTAQQRGLPPFRAAVSAFGNGAERTAAAYGKAADAIARREHLPADMEREG